MRLHVVGLVACVRVANARAASRVRHGASEVVPLQVEEQARQRAQDVHLLPDARVTVELARCPAEPARRSRDPVAVVYTVRARIDGRSRADPQRIHDLVVHERRQLRGAGHPAVQVALEALHVGRTAYSLRNLARPLDGRAICEEDIDGLVG